MTGLNQTRVAPLANDSKRANVRESMRCAEGQRQRIGFVLDKILWERQLTFAPLS
jgi:hypothetical protein